MRTCIEGVSLTLPFNRYAVFPALHSSAKLSKLVRGCLLESYEYDCLAEPKTIAAGQAERVLK